MAPDVRGHNRDRLTMYSAVIEPNAGSGKDKRLSTSSQQSTQSSANSVRKKKSGLWNGVQRAGSLSNVNHSLDSRQVLEAFRLIGSVDGICYDDLKEAFTNVRNMQLRKALLKDLADLFPKFDETGKGHIGLVEFEAMLKDSTNLEAAIHELLNADAQAEEEQAKADMNDVKQSGVHAHLNYWQSIFSCMVVLDIFLMAIAVDSSIDWEGWRVINLLFATAFSVDIAVRLVVDRMHFRRYWTGNTFDVVITTVDWLAVCLAFAPLDNLGTNEVGLIPSLRVLRFLRFAKFARITRLIGSCPRLCELTYGLMLSLASAMWGFLSIVIVVFMWAIFIRHVLVLNLIADDSRSIERTFPNILDSTLVLVRCMGLTTSGACIEPESNQPIYNVLAAQFDSPIFKLAWMASEVIIQLGILNAIASMFVVRAFDSASDIKACVKRVNVEMDTVRLKSLDKLLRALIHPTRKNNSNPKDRNATEVAKMIRLDYPEVAKHIPDLELELVRFASSILDAKKLHQQAMDLHEAREGKECKTLYGMPCANTYVEDGREVLMAAESTSVNSLALPQAPMGAVEVLLTQEEDDPEILIDEALEVQQHVKSVILPNSSWAAGEKMGESGQIWKASKGLCDECSDPGVKSLERLHQKVAQKYEGRYQRNRDTARLGLLYNTIAHLTEAIPKFMGFSLDSPEGMQVVTIENRFTNPHVLGWRDVTLLVKVLVPSTGSHHIMEMQLQLQGLKDARGEAHVIYEEIRAQLPNSLVETILDRLVTDTTLDLGITKQEWLQCIKNREVRALLVELGIPEGSLNTLFDVIDIDGSGKVTSTELQSTLTIFQSALQAPPELVACHLRVQEIQREMHNRIEPKLSMLTNFVATSHETILRHLGVSEAPKRRTVVARRTVTNEPTRGRPSYSAFNQTHRSDIIDEEDEEGEAKSPDWKSDNPWESGDGNSSGEQGQNCLVMDGGAGTSSLQLGSMRKASSDRAMPMNMPLPRHATLDPLPRPRPADAVAWKQITMNDVGVALETPPETPPSEASSSSC